MKTHFVGKDESKSKYACCWIRPLEYNDSITSKQYNVGIIYCARKRIKNERERQLLNIKKNGME